MPPSSANLGVALSVSTATLWAISPMFMASVGRRVGSHHTNLLRLLVASGVLLLAVLPPYLWVHGSAGAIPNPSQFLWLILSSIAGMVLGDACFYEALLRLGPRRAVKMLTLSPVLSLAIAWFWLDEKITPMALGGAAMVIGGVLYATMMNPGAPDQAPVREPGRMTPAGLAFGIGAAIGGALGAVLIRRAFQVPSASTSGLDAIVAATIRVVIAAVVMWVIALFSGEARQVAGHIKDPALRNRLLAGTLLGPVCGILCYVGAMKHAEAGLVSTISSASPLLIIPITMWKYRVRLRPDIILATVIAFGGVAMISIAR